MGYFPLSDNAKMILSVKASSNPVIIFDGLVCIEQSVIREYLTMGRHRNVGLFLRVTITRVPHHASPIQIQSFDFQFAGEC